MPQLPPELVLVILEHCYYTSYGSPDYTTLANSSLVCTSWSEPARSLLFRKPLYLHALYRVKSFHAALVSSAARGQPIGHAVRSLSISVGSNNQDLVCQPEVLVQLLEACHGLYELTLGMYHFSGKFEQLVLLGLEWAGKNIRALNLLWWDGTSPALSQLLGIWPRIQFLKIGRPNGSFERRFAHSWCCARVSLYELKLKSIPAPACLSRLLASSASSLRILDFLQVRQAPSNAHWEILRVHAPRLRSLRLGTFDFQSADFVRECTLLEELVTYIPEDVYLAPYIPPSIKHLSFRTTMYPPNNTLRQFIDAIAVLPDLRVLTYNKYLEHIGGFSTLKMACAERGIEMVWLKDSISVDVNEDPVVVDHFPRRHSVSNFKLMNCA